MKRSLVVLVFISFTTLNCFAQKENTFQVNKEQQVDRQRLPLVADGPIKNVIFIIGDGTGLVQLTSGQYHLVGEDGLLHVQTMPVTGIVKTHAASNLITDSAAGATAYSCGIKTDNGKIAQLPDERNCRTILELAERKGLSTGLVSTSGVTHATPASYASHVPSRRMEAMIAAQYLSSGTDVILGGGLEYFIPSNEKGSSREDNRDLISEFEGLGYTFVENKEELHAVNSEKILGLFSDSGMPSENRTPTLAEMTSKAIDALSKNEEGFFLMVEGSQIDWGGHGNDTPYVLREVADFDAAIAKALEFAQNDGETLVIVTADHETGGMTLNGYNRDSHEVDISWTTTSHTGVPIPLMAYGPHAVEFTGWLDNTEVGQKTARLLGLGELPIIIEE